MSRHRMYRRAQAPPAGCDVVVRGNGFAIAAKPGEIGLRVINAHGRDQTPGAAFGKRLIDRVGGTDMDGMEDMIRRGQYPGEIDDMIHPGKAWAPEIRVADVTMRKVSGEGFKAHLRQTIGRAGMGDDPEPACAQTKGDVTPDKAVCPEHKHGFGAVFHGRGLHESSF